MFVIMLMSDCNWIQICVLFYGSWSVRRSLTRLSFDFNVSLLILMSMRSFGLNDKDWCPITFHLAFPRLVSWIEARYWWWTRVLILNFIDDVSFHFWIDDLPNHHPCIKKINLSLLQLKKIIKLFFSMYIRI